MNDNRGSQDRRDQRQLLEAARRREREALRDRPADELRAGSMAAQIRQIEEATADGGRALDMRRWVLLDWIIVFAVILLFSGIAWGIPSTMLEWIAARADHLPPSMDGRRWLYAAAMCGLGSITVLCTHTLIENIRLMRSDTGKKIRATVVDGPTWKHPAMLVLIIDSLYMAAFILGTAPDAFFLILYGEQSDAARNILLLVDRSCDFLAFPIVAIAFLLRSRASLSIGFQLTKEPVPTELWPTWFMVRDKLYMIGLTLTISVGVALAK